MSKTKLTSQKGKLKSTSQKCIQHWQILPAQTYDSEDNFESIVREQFISRDINENVRR